MIDLTKLPPTPWTAEEGSGFFKGSGSVSYQQDRWNGATETAETVRGVVPPEQVRALAIVARQAFDVIVRRGWAARRFHAGGWTIDYASFDDTMTGTTAFMDYLANNQWSDPFTALVAADEWMKAHEVKP